MGRSLRLQPAEMRCTSGAHISAERSGGWLQQTDAWLEPPQMGKGLRKRGDQWRPAADNRYEPAALARRGIAPFEGMAGGFLAQMPEYANAYSLIPPRLAGIGQVEYDGVSLIRACVGGVCGWRGW